MFLMIYYFQLLINIHKFHKFYWAFKKKQNVTFNLNFYFFKLNKVYYNYKVINHYLHF
jgi:hypothetical protein